MVRLLESRMVIARDSGGEDGNELLDMNSSGGHTALWMYIMALNHHLVMVKMVDFMYFATIKNNY